MNLSEIIEKIKEKTIYVGNCHLFTGALSSGYGMIRFNGRMVNVHRLSAAYYLGLDLNDSSQQANHAVNCILKNCWNPEHLYVGTETDNKRDRKDKFEEHTGNQYTNITHCKHGHEFTPENTYQYNGGQRRCKQCYKNRYNESRGRF